MLLKKLDGKVYLFLTKQVADGLDKPLENLQHCIGVLEPSDPSVTEPVLASAKYFYSDVTYNGDFKKMDENQTKTIRVANLGTYKGKVWIIP